MEVASLKTNKQTKKPRDSKASTECNFEVGEMYGDFVSDCVRNILFACDEAFPTETKCGTHALRTILLCYNRMDSRDFSCETDSIRRNRQNVYFDESDRR